MFIAWFSSNLKKKSKPGWFSSNLKKVIKPNWLLRRGISSPQGTLGTLLFKGRFICHVNELPDLANQRGISRIPSGIYKVKFLDSSASGRYKECYHVTEVPGRSGILFHSGNLAGDIAKGYQSDSRGCPLPGLKVGFLSGQRAVLQSKLAMRRIHKFTGKKGFTLEVLDA